MTGTKNKNKINKIHGSNTLQQIIIRLLSLNNSQIIEQNVCAYIQRTITQLKNIE